MCLQSGCTLCDDSVDENCAQRHSCGILPSLLHITQRVDRAHLKASKHMSPALRLHLDTMTHKILTHKALAHTQHFFSTATGRELYSTAPGHKKRLQRFPQQGPDKKVTGQNRLQQCCSCWMMIMMPQKLLQQRRNFVTSEQQQE